MITEEEAELELTELWRDVEAGWNSFAAIAEAIAVGRGFHETSVAFQGHLADGERYSITWEEFWCIPTTGAEFTISREDSINSVEEARWQELELAAEHLESIVPPVVEGRVDSFEDLKGYEDDVRMVLFADYDGDGNFQYDEKGMKSNIIVVWL